MRTTQILVFINIIIFSFLLSGCQKVNDHIQVIERLVEREIPELKEQVAFQFIPGENNKDIFKISSDDGKVVIEGNNILSITSGLNWYLKYYCNVSFSWGADQAELPAVLPLPDSTIVKTTPFLHNFYLNYCAFNYTMTFWDWERWEREIDLMALNGVTTPMAIVGTEVVWRNTLREFGYSDDEIKRFISGPSYLSFLLMGNLQGLGGPLPDEWFDKQAELQRKILKRMREYGMKPVMHGFYGMVPATLKDKYPEAKIIEQGKWGGGTLIRPSVLAPSDPLFGKMAEVWYQEQKRLFGKADYFGGDLFHEGGKSGDLNVTLEASKVQEMMLKHNPEAVWVIQAWGNNPLDELLAGLKKEHTLIVDLCAEYWTRWKDRGGFNGFPWIWSNISNWGGNIGLHGRLDAIASGPINALNDSIASKSMAGVGSTPEGIETNPVVFDLANEMRWRTQTPDMEKWIEDYAVRRYGEESLAVKQAWQIFYNTAYGTYETHRRASESVFCARPNLAGLDIKTSAFGQTNIFYDPDEFAKGVELLLSEAGKLKSKDTYQYDAVDMVRQYLANEGRIAYYQFVKAYNENDLPEFRQWSNKFLDLLLDQDALLSTYPHFTVDKWIQEARGYSDDEEMKDIYEYNLRLQITTWNDIPSQLHDYASKEWSGILKDLYYPRWVAFISSLEAELVGGTVEKNDFFEMEKDWVESHNVYASDKMGSPVEKASELFEKYYGNRK